MITLLRLAPLLHQSIKPLTLSRSIIPLALIFALYPAAAKADDNSGVFIGLFVFGLFLFIIYFLPTMVAFNRTHPNRWVILALNVFLGGTGIVWIICLIWAMKAIHISEDRAGFGNSDGGESGLNIFVNDEKRIRVVNQMEVGRQVTAAKKADVATQIARLKGLLDSGALTRSEFDNLKRKLIDNTRSG
jgi:hypothetical protein